MIQLRLAHRAQDSRGCPWLQNEAPGTRGRGSEARLSPRHHPRCAGTGRGLRGPGRALAAARRPPLLAGAALRPRPRLRGRPQRPAGHRRPLSALPRSPLSPQRPAGHCRLLGTLASRPHPLSARLGMPVPSGIPPLLSSPQRPSPQDQAGYPRPLSTTLSPASPWQPFEAPPSPQHPTAPHVLSTRLAHPVPIPSGSH